jgi:hypothetical protein
MLLAVWVSASVADADEAAISRVTVKDGAVTLSLAIAAEQRLGLTVSPALASDIPVGRPVPARVTAIGGLLERRQDYRRDQLALSAAERRRASASAQLAHLAELRGIGAVVSAEQRQSAEAARESARNDAEQAQARLAATAETLRYDWGPALAEAALATGSTLMTALADHHAQLLLLSPAPDAQWPLQVKRAFYQRESGASQEIEVVGPAPTVAAGAASGAWWGVAQDPGLRVGMTVEVQLRDGPRVVGVRVPSSSLIWHEGLQWVYLREAPAQFVRRAAGTVRYLSGGDALITGAPAASEVVVQGAQSLLGEELRWSIPADSED